ncbi:MAG TPA: glycine zipper domain-containing protein [Hanamia sp.]|nr:glycine zipper domain-containing protein [Hanamia sp.]
MTTYSKLIKLLFLPFIFLFVFTACNNNKKSDTTRDIQLLPDSSAYHNNASTDSAKMSAANTVPAAPVRSSHTNPVETHHTSSSTTHSSTSKASTSTASSGTVSNSGSTSSSQGTTKKKGWSKAAQGAVIGGAAGAVGGAIISKHKGTGAAIGAAVGAAGGYIIGRNKDKKDGRVKK